MFSIAPFRTSLFSSTIVSMVALLITGFILLIFFILYTYSIHLNTLNDVLLEGEAESQKMLIISELMEVARSRTRLSSQIIDLDDPFEKDELNMRLESYAGRFASLRNRLNTLPLSQQELDILSSNNEVVKEILPAQRASVEMAMNDESNDDERAESLLYDVVLPGQQKLIDSFGRLITIEQQRIADLTHQSRQSLQSMMYRSTMIVSIVLVISVGLSYLVVYQIRKVQQELRLSHQQLKQANVNLEAKVEERTAELYELNQRLRDASEHDELTNLYNRRKFNDFIKNEYTRTNRTETCFALIMIDVDCFKLYNDFYGHQKGDQCLANVAMTMSMSLPRSIDFIARYGGEEFVVVLPSTDVSGAKQVAEKLRKAVRDLKIPHEKSMVDQYVTVSQGIAVYQSTDESSIEDIIENADQCLYAAKAKGRNLIVSMS